MRPFQKVVRRAGCPYCGASPGDPCVARSGRPISTHHAPRVACVRDAWALGFYEGLTEARDMVERKGSYAVPTLERLTKFWRTRWDSDA